jgi:hypothetical protein
MVGMTFDSITDVENFYKGYAHDGGFSVRIGQHKNVNDEIKGKYFYCAREGYRAQKDKKDIDQSGKKRKKRYNVMETRCGCAAHIYVNLGTDKKYKIASMVEQHNHGLVSPFHRHFLRSNRHVTERAKSTLYNCHKSSIGTSLAFRLMHVSDGGFQNVGCTLSDLKNYYRDLRTKIKDVDAQIFVCLSSRGKRKSILHFL